MAVITRMQVRILTGNEDPSKDTRVYVGFSTNTAVTTSPGGGREFRLRKNTGSDANPYRESTDVTLTFGIGSDVRNPELNNPANPATSDFLGGNFTPAVYIRISPGSTESWLINSATVSTFSGVAGTTLINVHSFPTVPGQTVTLQEDSTEIVYLTL